VSDVITKWYGDQVLAKLSGKVVDGMERASSFAADRAGSLAPVRTRKLQKGIDHVVIAQKEEVVGIVGVTKKSKAWYARFPELGTKFMKAQPFLRPAVFNNRGEILRLIAGGK
jgi:HK97 gp10 family phage protein